MTYSHFRPRTGPWVFKALTIQGFLPFEYWSSLNRMFLLRAQLMMLHWPFVISL